jgi:hypothetical protein
MKRVFRTWIWASLVSAALMFTVTSRAQTPAPATTPSQKTKAAPKAVTPPPSDADIAAAKSKGLVWVNTSTKVYHKDGVYYGKTKQGKFMTVADAEKAGYKAAQDPKAEKKPSPSKK